MAIYGGDSVAFQRARRADPHAAGARNPRRAICIYIYIYIYTKTLLSYIYIYVSYIYIYISYVHTHYIYIYIHTARRDKEANSIGQGQRWS